MPQRKRLRSRQRPDRANQQAAGEVQHDRGRRETAGDDQADAQRAGLPHGQRRPAPATTTTVTTICVSQDDADAGLVAQQQRRLDVPHVEQRHERKQQRDEQADAEALQHGRRGQARRDVDARHRAGEERWNRRDRQRRRARRRACCRPGRAPPPARCRSPSSCDERAPTHFRTAMLFIFCWTKTRVTLDTPMPPRMTITRSNT